jgi:hypothetical protein
LDVTLHIVREDDAFDSSNESSDISIVGSQTTQRFAYRRLLLGVTKPGEGRSMVDEHTNVRPTVTRRQ